jgi:hypothetical protein
MRFGSWILIISVPLSALREIEQKYDSFGGAGRFE